MLDETSMAAAKPIYTLPQIITQLTTSWGYGDTLTRKWDSSTITFSTPDTAPTNVGGYSPPEASGLQVMTAKQKGWAALAFRFWDDVIATTIQQTTDPGANITFNYSSSTSGGGTYSRCWYTSAGSYNQITADQIWLNSNWSTHLDVNMNAETYGVATYIHEIGHSLGLSHPGPYNGSATYEADAVYQQDNRRYTIMSYFGGYDPVTRTWPQDGTFTNWLYPDTPMVDDIAALQFLYGADTTTRTGNNIYGFNCNLSSSDPEKAILDFSMNTTPIYTIWDAGGTDTFDASGYAGGAQTIDLTPGAYSSVNGMTTNIGVAYDVTVENAIGGGGSDTITGNTANNSIEGRLGADVIYGRDGDDSLLGNQENDEIYGEAGGDYIHGGQNNDILYGNAGNDTVYGGYGNDYVHGGQDNDTLYGNQDNDTIYGAMGNDYAHGGQGNDIIYGGDGDDTLWGGLGSNIIDGEAGNNTACFGYNYSDYTFGSDGGYTTVTNKYTGGVDRLLNIQHMQFADGLFTPSLMCI